MTNIQFSFEITNKLDLIDKSIALLSNESMIETGMDQLYNTALLIKDLCDFHNQNMQAKPIPENLKSFIDKWYNINYLKQYSIS